jgi:hypothetical protein
VRPWRWRGQYGHALLLWPPESWCGLFSALCADLNLFQCVQGAPPALVGFDALV